MNDASRRRDGPHRARYRRIVSFAARELIAIWWFELVLPRFGMSRTAERTRPRRMQLFARRFRMLAIDLGGLMIKVGQFLSSRLDVLPPEITDELARLQDEVPAVPFAEIKALAEAELGTTLLPTADTHELERALTALFDRFGGMGFAELRGVDPSELTDVAAEFGDTVRSLPLQLPEHLLLLIRAVSLTSGLCSALEPSFNIWDPVEPYAQRLLRDEGGDLLKDLGAQVVSKAGVVWRLPKRVDDLVSRVDEGSVTFDTSRLEKRLDIIVGVARRAVLAILFAGFVVGGALLLAPALPLGIVLLSACALPLLHALFGGRRAQRK